MNLEDLEIYKLSMDVGERIWKIVDKWSYFPKDTIGKQLVKSADSIAANISEGLNDGAAKLRAAGANDSDIVYKRRKYIKQF